MHTTETYSQRIAQLRQALDTAVAVLIGAGAGLSASAGLTYDGARFLRYFSDFHEAYGITDMYTGGFYPFPSPEEYWGWWCRHIYYNRYTAPTGEAYRDLLHLMDGREYFVLTTNVDHQFQLAGFDPTRLFCTQGDYGLWQCSVPCQPVTYDNEAAVREMVARQHGMQIPTELIPACPACGAPMTMNLRCDDRFVEDSHWHEAAARYTAFLERSASGRLLLLELGVGFNTPGIIKFPFLRMTARNPEALYACINRGQACTAPELEARSILIDADIATVLRDLLSS